MRQRGFILKYISYTDSTSSSVKRSPENAPPSRLRLFPAAHPGSSVRRSWQQGRTQENPAFRPPPRTEEADDNHIEKSIRCRSLTDLMRTTASSRGGVPPSTFFKHSLAHAALKVPLTMSAFRRAGTGFTRQPHLREI